MVKNKENGRRFLEEEVEALAGEGEYKEVLRRRRSWSRTIIKQQKY